MPAIKKLFDLIGDDIVKICAKNESLKNKLGSYEEKWFKQPKAKLLKQINGEKKANLIMSRMEK